MARSGRTPVPTSARLRPHWARGERPDRRSPGRVRVAARAGGGEPVHVARVPPRRGDHPRRRRLPVARARGAGRVRELRGIGRGIEARLRELVETGDIAELAELERELSPGPRRPRPLPRAGRAALDRAGAGARRQHRRRAAGGGGRRPAAERAGHRPEDRGADPRGARARGRAAPPRVACCSTARASWSAPWRPRSAASRPATCGGGATRASSSRWSARRRTARPCWRASPRCRRSSRWSSRTSGARWA